MFHNHQSPKHHRLTSHSDHGPLLSILFQSVSYVASSCLEWLVSIDEHATSELVNTVQLVCPTENQAPVPHQTQLHKNRSGSGSLAVELAETKCIVIMVASTMVLTTGNLKYCSMVSHERSSTSKSANAKSGGVPFLSN